MNIRSARLYRYTLPVREPLYIRGQLSSRRKGLLFVLESSEGKSGVGEAAPLGGVSRDNLEEVLIQLRELSQALPSTPVPPDPGSLKRFCLDMAERHALTPAARFAFETATVSLCAAVHDIGLHRMLNPRAQGACQIQALLTGPVSADRIVALVNCRYRAFKVKVGGDPAHDAQRVALVRKTAGPGIGICADANGRWTLAEAVAFGTMISEYDLAYVEEPCLPVAAIAEFSATTHVGAALDESFETDMLTRKELPGGVSAIVLKPTVKGGLFENEDLIKSAQSQGVGVTLSSSYESRIGVSAIASLSAAFCGAAPAGIDTLRFFAGDILRLPRIPSHGEWHCAPKPCAFADLETSCIESIPR